LLVVVLIALGCEAPPMGPGDPGLPEGRPPQKGPPPAAVGGFSAILPELTVAAGDELSPCWILPLEVSGPSRFVGGALLTVGPGLHHGNIIARKRTGDGVRRCPPGSGTAADQALDVINGGQVLFANSTQVKGEEWQSFPAGMAYALGDDLEIVARMHYLNASSAPLVLAPRYDWYTVDPATVVNELAPFAWDFSDIDIPPLARAEGGGDCFFNGPMHVVQIMPHMHRMGVAAEAGFVGGPRARQRWFDSPGYDPDNGVIEQFSPAIDLSQAGQGDGVWFRCVWQNQLDKRLEYGIGDDEMCTLFGYAYPPQHSYTLAIGQKQACAVLPAR
jgi:hypothetical protein